MKKLNIEKSFVKVTLSMALLMSQSGFSETYDNYQESFKKDFGKAESAFSAVIGKSGTPAADSLADKLKATLENDEKIVSQDKEETDQRLKLKTWAKKNDALKNLKGIPDVLLQKALKSRQLELDKTEKLAAQLGTNAVTNTSNFSTSNLPKACQKNVDFSQVRGLLDQLNTEPGAYLKKASQGLINEKRDDLKAKQVQKIADVMKYFKELSEKDESVEALANGDTKADSVDARIAQLKAKNGSQKKLNKELKGDVVDVFSKFIGQLGAIKENDKRVGQLGAEFTKMIQSIRGQATQAAQEQTEQLLKNCDNELAGLNSDIQVSYDYMVQSGIRADVAQLDTQAQLQRAQSLQCQDVGANIQSILQGGAGSNINNRIASIAAAKEPAVLMSEAVSAMTDVANMQSQVSEQLKPLMQDCEEVANAREAVKQRIQPLQQGGQANKSSALGQNGAPRSSGSPNVGYNGSPTNHFGNQGFRR
ncbi:MAG: hypothetical protein HQ462_11550 [Deltaproteobacteria bacterium]|nr:hypothetical protein [Deltaproteobacteria bacterium]